jgi:hypothetical protein
MNEELTRDVLEAMKKCSENSCSECPAVDVCCSEDDWEYTIQTLATALLEERAKPKVWDGAPEWATVGRVVWTDKEHDEGCSKLYRREPPKTRARQIAEQEGHGLAEKYGWNASAKELVTNVMESALNKYAEELKGEA